MRGFLDELESQQFALGTAYDLEAYYQWRGEPTNRVAQTGRLLTDISSRADYAAIVESWRPKVTDSVLRRRLDLHHITFLKAKANPAQLLAHSDLQAAVQDSIEKFRYSLDGKQYNLTAIYAIVDSASDRSRRRAAFLAEPQRSAMIGRDVVHAMWLNDSIARQEGFPTAIEAGLYPISLERSQVLRDLDAFERATRPTYLALLDRVKHDLAVDRVEAWDIGYWLHVQERNIANAYPKDQAIDRLRTTFRTLGFKVDSLPIDVQAFDVPTGGITFPIRPPFEARLLTNPLTGSDFYETLFHEYGHALNAVTMRRDLSPIFLNIDATPLGEGSAETMGWFAYDPGWIARTAHVSPAQAQHLARVGKDHLLFWLRRSIALHAWVELTAYADLHANLDSIYRDAYHRFVGVEVPPAAYVGNVDNLATGPLYFQSYLYANMIAAQFHDAMRAQLRTNALSSDPRVAEWMIRNVYADGALVPWPTKVTRATGRPLTIDALVDYLTKD